MIIEKEEVKLNQQNLESGVENERVGEWGLL